MMYFKDKKTGKPSVTLTMFVLGFVTVTLKLLLAGITLGSIVIAPFSGIEYAAAIAALGGVYTLRKRDTIKSDKDESNDV